jgi:hypothetical protein
MEKVEEYQFKLVEGQYTTVEAQKILLGLINSKINFHQLEHFSNEIRFNENNNHSKIRVVLPMQQNRFSPPPFKRHGV